ncbi:hypothetical protein PUR28_20180 [Streptomyces sp. BE308]|uniref:hypothetical protein n=1 Tax=Streptomyces sp. BE308 TaxID=3002529 RepID=UPI002E791C84|nr:hypothetical protein [Streptomyces sp. BE308]MEE1793043.1 hypothetical protein [Streptomyces sp. BE308]
MPAHVDAAQPYVPLVLTEVAQRHPVPVGDLPFLVQRPAVPRLSVGLLGAFIGLPGLNVPVPETHHGHGTAAATTTAKLSIRRTPSRAP